MTTFVSISSRAEPLSVIPQQMEQHLLVFLVGLVFLEVAIGPRVLEQVADVGLHFVEGNHLVLPWLGLGIGFLRGVLLVVEQVLVVYCLRLLFLLVRLLQLRFVLLDEVLSLATRARPLLLIPLLVHLVSLFLTG